jgi:hypothetical protein
MDPERGQAISEIETVCRDILHRVAHQERLISRGAPDVPSTDYLTGHAAGRLDGQLSTAAIVLGLLIDGSPTQLLEDARAQAAVEESFPFDLHIDPA